MDVEKFLFELEKTVQSWKLSLQFSFNKNLALKSPVGKIEKLKTLMMESSLLETFYCSFHFTKKSNQGLSWKDPEISKLYDGNLDVE